MPLMWGFVRYLDGLYLIGLCYGRGLQIHIALRENYNGISLSMTYINFNKFWSFFPNCGRKEHICKISSCLPHARGHVTILRQIDSMQHRCDWPTEWLGLPVCFLAHGLPIALFSLLYFSFGHILQYDIMSHNVSLLFDSFSSVRK